MLAIDLTGKRAFVAGVADDAGFGFAIAKSLAEAGATVCLGTWPPALGIFQTLLRRGKLDASLVLSSGRKLEFERILPFDAEYDTTRTRLVTGSLHVFVRGMSDGAPSITAVVRGSLFTSCTDRSVGTVSPRRRKRRAAFSSGTAWMSVATNARGTRSRFS